MILGAIHPPRYHRRMFPFHSTFPAPAEPNPAHPAARLALQLDLILTSVMGLVAAMFRLLGPRTLPIWTRFSRSRRRLVNLLNALAEGRTSVGRARHAAPGAPTSPRRHGAPAPHLPRRPGWLVYTVGYRAAGFGSQLQHLLDDPATLATLAAAPAPVLAYAARTLRPLCRMLRVQLPAILQAPPRDEPPREAPPRERPARLRRAARPKLPPTPQRESRPQREPRPLSVLPPLTKKCPG